jgi:hypothetical protein
MQETNNLPQNPPLQQTAVSGWVAVSERTPETNDLCLCATEYGYSFRYWKGNHFEGEHVANEPKVTHWMYAPKPPCT